ncbi:MAG TPA: AAA family ATPase [Gemmataceae bacterium]|nr:AAA family ATPase [Gemmataceae bacterium]
MFQSFTVKNFRCFRELTLAPLERINLIAGKNNSGKTALLEAIHLHSYPCDCELPFLINERRGMDSEKKYDEKSCERLFFDKKEDSGVELLSKNEKGEVRTLQIWLLNPVNARLKFPDLALEEQKLKFPPTDPRFRWIILKANTNEKDTFSFAVPQGERFLPASSNHTPWNGPSIFLGSAGRSPNKDVLAFSNLELANRQEEILPPLHFLEPRLQRLSILLLAEQPVIHGRLDGLSRMVPVQFMGEGVRRLLSILLAINEAKGGNILIDEIENGLHYSVLKDVWQAIALAARMADVQVFATTHSYECIQAASQAFQAQETNGLRHFRLDRIQDEIRLAVYTQEILNFAIEMTHEVR